MCEKEVFKTNMINNEYKFIFMHITKTGGSSIEKLFNYEGIKHQRPIELINILGQTTWDSYFKFTFVRNPWDRTVSEYFYRREKGSVATDFKSWLKSMSRDSWAIGLQSNWLQDKDFDFIGKFENLQEDFEAVCEQINYPKVKLPHINSTSHEHYSMYYDEETKEIVREWHQKDIEKFNYDFCNTMSTNDKLI